MEEERTNNETLEEQEDDCYIFDDGTKVPWNRMNAIWEAKYNEKCAEVSCGFIHGRNRHYFLPSY